MGPKIIVVEFVGGPGTLNNDLLSVNKETNSVSFARILLVIV